MFTVKLLLVLNPLVLAIVLAYSYGNVTRFTGPGRRRNLAMGLIMGVAAMIAMLFPFSLADGIILDMRNLIVGLAAAFFGVAGAVVAVAIAAVTRIGIGGVGMPLGLAGIAIAGLMGLIWARFFNTKTTSPTFQRILLGVMISSHLIAGLWLPDGARTAFFTQFAPWFFIFNIVGACMISALIDREKRMLDETIELRSAATTDPLTQLLNRRSILDSYDALPIAQKPHHGTAMLCFDVDHFKQINDEFGHPLGDEVLMSITSRVSGCLRPKDLFSRIGGDEFVVVLSNVTQDETRAVAERCREIVARSPIAAMGRDIPVTISIGADWTLQHREFSSFLLLTDAALYNAKELGRDCVAYAFNKTHQRPSPVTVHNA